MYFYVQFARNFSWIPSQVDDEEIDTVFDFLRVAQLTQDGGVKADETVSIDQVLW